ncbi:hypothetical protein B0T10DRAFT_572253 [Thelonectria olida]|uniref:Uncharacterized protein n=1 Tax=Thelonectria olida TaxID=1576542 RepID=A0A9P9AJ47_9HYPO|nr:hypothetical protein B0T10DRAFT_572253 [Thelonectria olida]
MTTEFETDAQAPPIRLIKDKFSDQVVAVTGAAQGIGLTTAQLFASQGATVILLDIQEDRLKEAVSAIKEAGGASGYHVCDISDEKAVKASIEWIILAYSKLDVLAHIAGIYPNHSLLSFPTEVYRKTMSINIDASFFLVREVLPHMQCRGYGRIILTSSSTVQEPENGLTAYVASKAAVIGLVRAAAIETGPGITINTVMPGLVKTPTVWDLGVREDGSHPLFEHVLAKQVVKRCGLPEDIGHAVCFLASPEASFITGQILDLSGGATFH